MVTISQPQTITAILAFNYEVAYAQGSELQRCDCCRQKHFIRGQGRAPGKIVNNVILKWKKTEKPYRNMQKGGTEKSLVDKPW